MIFLCLAHTNGKEHYRWECCGIRSQCWDTWDQAHDMLNDHRKGGCNVG
jgi:hypothetical protein